MAQRTGRVGVGKFKTFLGELVDVGSGDLGIGIEASRVSIAHVIGKDDNDVGFVGSKSGAKTEEGKSELLEEGHCRETRGFTPKKQRREIR